MLRKVLCVCLLSMAASAMLSGQKPGKLKPALDVAVQAESPSDIEFIEGKVLLVIDGDQFRVKASDGAAYNVRLHGVDAPEDLQPFGPESRKALEEIALGKDVKVVVHRKDSQGRYIGTAYIGGQDIAVKQLERGNAWHYKRFGGEQASDARMRYAMAELKARDAKKGLWTDAMPVPPWEYRESLAPTDASKQEANVQTLASAPPTSEAKPPENASGRKYVMGPRGGCYYLNGAGTKVYVKDKTLCTKP